MHDYTMILVHPMGEPVEPPSRTLSCVEGHPGSNPVLGLSSHPLHPGSTPSKPIASRNPKAILITWIFYYSKAKEIFIVIQEI